VLRIGRPWPAALALVAAVVALVVVAPLVVGNVGWVLVLRERAPGAESIAPTASAVYAFNTASALRPGWARPLVGLSFVEADPQARAALLDRAMRDDPAFEPGWLLLSRAEEAQGDLARADALVIDTHNSQLLAREGDRLVRKGELERAATLYQAAIDVEPTAWYPSVQLAELEMRDPARRGQAEQRLQALLQTSPTQVPALVLLARAQIEDRDWPAAQANLDAALRLDPNNGDAHFARARALRDGYADTDGALAELARARQTLPADGWVDVTIGETNLLASRADAAQDVLDPLCRRGGDSGAHACYLLADYYWRAGDRGRAEPLASRATELGSNPAYTALLRRVRDSA